MVDAQVCFPTSAFMLFMIVNAAIIAWALYSSYVKDQANRSLRAESIQNGVIAQRERGQKEAALQEMNRILDERIQQGGEVIPTALIPQATRGIPSELELVGYLWKCNRPERTLKLLGRNLGSGRYEYIAQSPVDPEILIPIYNNRQYDQLTTDDKVRVQGYKGWFNVFIY